MLHLSTYNEPKKQTHGRKDSLHGKIELNEKLEIIYEFAKSKGMERITVDGIVLELPKEKDAPIPVKSKIEDMTWPVEGEPSHDELLMWSAENPLVDELQKEIK